MLRFTRMDTKSHTCTFRQCILLQLKKAIYQPYFIHLMFYLYHKMSCNSFFNLQHRVVSQSFNVRGFKLSCFAFFCMSVIVNKEWLS